METGRENQARQAASVAVEMVNTIMTQYGRRGTADGVTYLNLLEHHKNMQSGFLWSNFCGVGMQYYLCKLYPEEKAYRETFRAMISNFLFFRQKEGNADTTDVAVKYHSGRGPCVNGGHGDCFFDDNIWVARNYLRAYELLGDAWYLDEARRVNNWVLSGWNEALGGLVWSDVGLTDHANEQHLERGLSANACGIMVNAMLSRLVKDEESQRFYRAWADRFYRFCKRMQNTPETYDYWNGIHTKIENGVRSDGAINRVHYSYNSGSMILADLLLYEGSETPAEKDGYLADAVATAAAAQTTFCARDEKTQQAYYRGDPWFAAILNEAFYELYAYRPATAVPYLEAFAQNVALAYENRDRESGLCPYQAPWQVTWDKNESYVIHQVGFAQQAVMAALYRRNAGQ